MEGLDSWKPRVVALGTRFEGKITNCTAPQGYSRRVAPVPVGLLVDCRRNAKRPTPCPLLPSLGQRTFAHRVLRRRQLLGAVDSLELGTVGLSIAVSGCFELDIVPPHSSGKSKKPYTQEDVKAPTLWNPVRKLAKTKVFSCHRHQRGIGGDEDSLQRCPIPVVPHEIVRISLPEIAQPSAALTIEDVGHKISRGEPTEVHVVDDDRLSPSERDASSEVPSHILTQFRQQDIVNVHTDHCHGGGTDMNVTEQPAELLPVRRFTSSTRCLKEICNISSRSPAPVPAIPCPASTFPRAVEDESSDIDAAAELRRMSSGRRSDNDTTIAEPTQQITNALLSSTPHRSRIDQHVQPLLCKDDDAVTRRDIVVADQKKVFEKLADNKRRVLNETCSCTELTITSGTRSPSSHKQVGFVQSNELNYHQDELSDSDFDPYGSDVNVHSFELEPNEDDVDESPRCHHRSTTLEEKALCQLEVAKALLKLRRANAAANNQATRQLQLTQIANIKQHLKMVLEQRHEEESRKQHTQPQVDMSDVCCSKTFVNHPSVVIRVPEGPMCGSLTHFTERPPNFEHSHHRSELPLQTPSEMRLFSVINAAAFPADTALSGKSSPSASPAMTSAASCLDFDGINAAAMKQTKESLSSAPSVRIGDTQGAMINRVRGFRVTAEMTLGYPLDDLKPKAGSHESKRISLPAPHEAYVSPFGSRWEENVQMQQQLRTHAFPCTSMIHHTAQHATPDLIETPVTFQPAISRRVLFLIGRRTSKRLPSNQAYRPDHGISLVKIPSSKTCRHDDDTTYHPVVDHARGSSHATLHMQCTFINQVALVPRLGVIISPAAPLGPREGAIAAASSLSSSLSATSLTRGNTPQLIAALSPELHFRPRPPPEHELIHSHLAHKPLLRGDAVTHGSRKRCQVTGEEGSVGELARG